MQIILQARKQIIYNLMSSQSHSLSSDNIDEICDLTNGYSGADMANLCREAALGPIRSINFNDIQHISADEVKISPNEEFVIYSLTSVNLTHSIFCEFTWS